MSGDVHVRFRERVGVRFPCAARRNIYMSSPRAAERVMGSIVRWIKDELKSEANPEKSAVGRPWERQFLGFCINAQGRIEIAERSLERFKDRVRDLWRSCQSLSSAELRDRTEIYQRTVAGLWAGALATLAC
ncbi:MAG: hypothetical protein ACREXM_19695 [Gammaproteobacteria bacterium]